ncbi:MAG: hypothetical protein IJ265_01010 [Oscillospiraceae bacterium]|nr:hypothetical protein [Oscillospiraceae bacterium]
MSTDGSKFRNSDLPAVEDRLGTEKQRDGLVRFMRECSTPMTIAVQGDWGTGKTSMMQLLQKQLEGENGCTLWFPTWQFAVLGEQDRLLMDLLMLLCCELKKSCSEMTEEEQLTFKKVFRFIRRVGRAATIGSLYLAAEAGKKLTNIDIPNAFGETVDELKNLDEEEKEEESGINYTSFVMQVSELHDNLTSLIDAYLNANGTERLYIFIDDLDRLEPVRAVELLEGIKNFLDIPRCVFMLAIDTKVVMEGLCKKYGDNMDAKKQEHFFDKIIQIPYKLPVHNYDLTSYMQDVLKGYDRKNLDKYVDFLEKVDIRNPRTIKRCVNFCLLHQCMDGEGAISGKDKDIFLHRFTVKMLELEQEDLYWEILAKIKTSRSNVTNLRNQLNGYQDKSNILDAIFQTFQISKNTSKKESIELFADYIIQSAPSDITWFKHVNEAQKMLDIAKIIKNDIKAPKPIIKLGVNKEWLDFCNSTIYEIAQQIEHKHSFTVATKIYGKQITLRCTKDIDRYTNSRILLEIQGHSHDFTSDTIFHGVEHRMESNKESGNKNTLIYQVSYPSIKQTSYIIWNILDTSSPNAPIYCVLRNAGIIT